MLLESAIVAVLVVLGAVFAGVLIRRVGTRLRQRSRRYRELELEGIDELRTHDMTYPEEPTVDVGWMREPDGRAADADRVLHEELARAREHTRRVRAARSRTRTIGRGKGAACLL